jgi:hypothetical protein
VTNKSGAADWNSGKVRRLLDKLLQWKKATRQDSLFLQIK